ncbi:penicillin-binding protein [Domibacillus robiginosus]|uniref:penicillin-binding protein n=1 Tax=Domibacillus robiginosus TaxID=1071054 RepID=UPI00067C444A|nr:penicillin-binding protein [Domibacillus robiginosus]
MMENRNNRKIGAAILFIGFALLFFILFSRVFYIQATGTAAGHKLKNEALEKYMRTDVLEASRGTIYDTNGEVIAEDTTSFTMAAILDDSVTTNPESPNHVVDPEKTAKVLAKYIDMDEEDILERLQKDGAFQVEFGTAGRGLTNSVKREIEAEKLPGITFTRQAKRFYPNGKFASHLIGFTQQIEKEDRNGNITFETEGQMGIEKSYEKYLQGKNGKIRYTSDLWGYLLPEKQEMVTEPENGDHMYLTIDSKIQTFMEDALSEVEAQYNPSKAFAIVAEAKTGKILAMSQRPTFHPGTREGLDVNWMNDLVEYSFEPGSTMKIFTLAAAIEEGTFEADAFYKSGRYKVKGGGSVGDHNGGTGWGDITYKEGIQRSSNVAIANMLEQMTPGVFRQYLEDFHFGRKTGIELPNEASGSILYNYPLEQVTTAFGQGSTVNALQMIQAATSIANDGKMMKPYIIDKIVDDTTGKSIVDTKPEVVGEPISKETADQTLDILETVVTAEHGTGKPYHIEGYNVAGKTGTAQLVGEDGRYLTGANNYLFSFMGMAPKEDPELIVYVAVAKPQLDGESGSAPVSKIFNPVMRNSLQYLNVKPDKKITSRTVTLKDFTGEKTFKARRAYADAGIDPVIIGTGSEIEKQVPAAGEKLLQGEKAVLLTSEKWTMPNMEGWAMRDVMKVAASIGLKVSYSGSGYVVSQNIEPNSAVKEGQKLIIKLEEPGSAEEANENANKESDQSR